MTCPDWRLLSTRRDRDPDAWERALEHVDHCGRCYEQALAEEPTLMFRRLSAPAVGKNEITAMKQAVAVLRRSSEHRSGASRSSRRSENQGRRTPSILRRSALLRAAALAALVIGAATLQGTGPGLSGDRPYDAPAATVAELAAGSWPSSDQSVAWPSVEHLPLIEAVDPSYGSVVQLADDDEMSLIVVMPPNDV